MSNKLLRRMYFLAAILMGLVIIALCSSIVGLKADLAEAQNKPPIYEYIQEDNPVYVPFEVPVRVEVPVRIEVPVEVEVVKYEPIHPRQFESVEQFEEWFEAQEFKLRFLPAGADCDDYTRRLQIEALKQGYLVSEALVYWGRYFDKRVTDERRAHIGNLVLIADTYYYVEPYPESFRMVKIVDRD